MDAADVSNVFSVDIDLPRLLFVTGNVSILVLSSQITVQWPPVRS